MLAIKYIVENPDKVKMAMKNRNMDLDEKIDKLIMLDQKKRAMMTEQQNLKARQNLASKEIPKIKKEGGNAQELLDEMKKLSNEVSAISKATEPLEIEIKNIIYDIPNMPHDSVPVGKDEESNAEVRKFGEPTKYDFEPKAHWDIGYDLGIMDAERAAKVTGSRFHFLKGYGARLERTLINFFLNTHTEKHGYSEVLPPFIVNRDSMTATGQLPKFEEDAFCLENTDKNYFLVPTAEVPVTNMHRDEILQGEDLPICYAAYSVCFRAEAGSAGRDTRGLIRQHQFDKVELVKFSAPETSYDELEKLTGDAEKILQLLGLPYRVVCLCTGDIGFSSAKTYDIEVWMPSYNRYVEISSCSNFEDFQARRAAIRYKNDNTDSAKLVHTLNGSGLAVGRTVAAILENYQQADGSVKVPEAIRQYMGTDVIK